MNPDRRVAEVVANSRDVRLTWDRALMGLDLAEMNARHGGRWSWGRLRPSVGEAKKK